MGAIVVVGGGIVGLALAYHLRDVDRRVVVFEKGTLGSGTTGASIAHVVRHQSAPDPREHALRRRAWEWYDPLVERGTLSFERVGTLHLAESATERDVIESLAAAHADLGIRTELLAPEDLARFGLSPASLRGGLYFPEDGFLDPTEVVRYLADGAREGGVEIETGVAVTDVPVEDGAVAGVETGAGRVEATTVVNAAGPWASRVNRMAGVSAPLRNTEGPIVVLQPDEPPSLPLTFFEDEYYLRSERGGELLAGRFTTAYDDAARLDPDHAHAVDESFYLDVAALVDRHLPSVGGTDLLNEWVGLRTVTPDGRPVVDETSVDGFHLAAGMSGYGVTLAPAVGDLLAEHLRTGTKPEPLRSLALDRFSGADGASEP